MNQSFLRAPKLQTGELVRLVSPASYPKQSDIDESIKVLESWGLCCDVGKYVVNEHGFMAGSDADRLEDLNNAFRDPEVRAILTTRGGAGAYRIADDIDFAAVKSDPKPLIGFSDITNLHLSLLRNCGLGGIHGCVWGENARGSVQKLLMTADSTLLRVRRDTVSAGVQIPGRAQGRLIGGNLQSLANSVGIRLPSFDGAVLFLEHHRIGGLGMVDRCLTQLLRCGALDGISGVVLGSFECLRNFSDRGWDVTDVLYDRLGSLKVPVLGGIYAGHDCVDKNGQPDQCSIPLGSLATVDVDDGILTVDPVVY